jgi:cytidylate kinase
MVKKKIGLAGKSGSGKDVVADYICDRYGYKKIAVADGIRDEANAFVQFALGIEAAKQDLPKSFDVVLESFLQAIWAKPTPPEIRILLQWWGTEYRRSKDSLYWVKRLSERLDNDEQIVVSDVRTPDEIEAIRQAGGEVWFVERPGVGSVGIANHYTEVALEGAVFDRTILNDQTLEVLNQKIDFIFQEC